MSGVVKLSFVGDIMVQHEQNEVVFRSPEKNAYDRMFDDIRFLFSCSDYVCGNLETPIASPPYSGPGTVFNTPAVFLNALRNVPIACVSTANNHCLDRGVSGIEKTLIALDMAGMEHVGTYRTESEAEETCLVRLGGLTIALMAFTYGVNSEYTGTILPDDRLWMVDLYKYPARAEGRKITVTGLCREGRRFLSWCLPRWIKTKLRMSVFKCLGETPKMPLLAYISDNVPSEEIDNPRHRFFLEKASRKIKDAKRISDFVFVLSHVGGQYNPKPGPYANFIMNFLEGCGVDFVIGSHPHTIHQVKAAQGKVFAYSLGNFCFTPGVGWYIEGTLADYGLVLHFYFDEKQKVLMRTTFNVVKSIVEDDGFARVRSVRDLQCNEKMLEELREVLRRILGVIDVDVPLEILLRGEEAEIDYQCQY